MRTITVPVKLARRGNLSGYSTTADGGHFVLDLHVLRDRFARANPGATIDLDCLWLTASAPGGAEDAWYEHHIGYVPGPYDRRHP